jgi:hypothetical protein
MLVRILQGKYEGLELIPETGTESDYLRNLDRDRFGVCLEEDGRVSLILIPSRVRVPALNAVEKAECTTRGVASFEGQEQKGGKR